MLFANCLSSDPFHAVTIARASNVKRTRKFLYDCNSKISVFVIFKVVCFYCTGIGGIHSNIKILDLSHNNISTISNQFFRPVELSLTHLHLSHNNLLNATREVFGNLRHLQWLDISHNKMYEMDFDMFRNTKRLQVSGTKYLFFRLSIAYCVIRK